MKKQTAVEWLFAHLLPFLEFSDPKEREHYRKCLAEAKAMEREQIEKAYTLGREQWQKYEFAHSNYENDVEVPTPRKYYNETYGGDK